MKFPVSGLAVSGVLATLLILGYARLQAQPPVEGKVPPKANVGTAESLIITTTSEDVVRRVKAAIANVKGDQHVLVENRIVKGKLTRSATRIGIKDVTLIDRAVMSTFPKNTAVLAETTVISKQNLAKVRTALQGVDAKLFQARLVDSKALRSGQLVSRGLLLPAKKPVAAPQQGH